MEVVTHKGEIVLLYPFSTPASGESSTTGRRNHTRFVLK